MMDLFTAFQEQTMKAPTLRLSKVICTQTADRYEALFEKNKQMFLIVDVIQSICAHPSYSMI